MYEFKYDLGDRVFYVNYSPIHNNKCEECNGSGRLSYTDYEYGGWEYRDCRNCRGNGMITQKWLNGWVEVVDLGMVVEIHITSEGNNYLTENHDVPIFEEDLFKTAAQARKYCKKNNLQLINK